MNSLFKDALRLTIITVVAGLALGFVYQITKAPIEAANEAATQAAYKAVYQSADSFKEMDGFDADAATAVIAAEYPDDTIDNCVIAYDASGAPIGYVITITSSAGYGGKITFSIGVTNDGILNGYSITNISETAGLGMRAKETGADTFSAQFENKPVTRFEVTKTGATNDSEINAISGATITSKAMTYGVDAGIAYYNSIAGGAN